MANVNTPATPELLYLLHGDPAELSETLASMRAPDVAEALRQLEPHVAAKVMASMPFDFSVQVFDEPELERHRCAIIQQMDAHAVGPLIEAMSSDQQADLFREVPEANRTRLLSTLDVATRDSLRKLLVYPPESAGGIMTTEFVSVPATWTVAQALEHISEVGRAKETVYAVYVIDPATHVLRQVVSLRELLVANRDETVTAAGDPRPPLVVTPETDREEAARLISKYNLLALPVVDGAQHILGIVTVDDVIDTLIREVTEDVQKFGGMEALDQPYNAISFWGMIRKRGGWLCALFLSEMLTATAMQHFEIEIEKAAVLAMFIPLVMSSGGNSRIAGNVAHHSRTRAPRVAVA
jgi:magnesium transporter